jgi:hypothetical protein
VQQRPDARGRGEGERSTSRRVHYHDPVDKGINLSPSATVFSPFVKAEKEGQRLGTPSAVDVELIRFGIS